MSILVGNDIAKAIEECEPEYIAVAYIGKDWRKFIKAPKKLKGMIISPTLGTNPKAVSELVSVIGWENVDFLDELHAKFFIGTESVITGSANLTSNGLSGHGLYELCTVTKDNKSLKICREYFDDLKSKAITSYPTITEKKERLNELYSLWGKAVANKMVVSESSRTKFEEFELLSNDHFYVSWYQTTDCEYSSDLEAVSDVIESDIHFLPTDDIKNNKWVLMWQKTNTDTADKRVNPTWLYIHDIFENGVKDQGYEYTSVAIERNDLEIPAKPFELTSKVVNALKLAVENEANNKFFIQSDKEVYDTNFAQQNLSGLIHDMKAAVKNVN